MASAWELGGLSLKELCRRVWRDIMRGDVFTHAAALSYYFFLALFPLLLFLVALLGSFTRTAADLRSDLLEYLSKVVPYSASALIHRTLDEITQGSSGSKLSFGLLAALWVASYGVGAISQTLNEEYGVDETRPWWKVRFIAIGLTVALAVLTISALAVVLYGGQIGKAGANFFGLGNAFTFAWKFLQIAIALVFVLITFALIYYYAPNIAVQKWYWITPGSVAGVFLWLLASYALRLYLHFYNSYTVTYGSLGAVIILLLWFYLTGAAILIGGEINSEIENAAAEQGTPGAKKHGERRPAGRRARRKSGNLTQNHDDDTNPD